MDFVLGLVAGILLTGLVVGAGLWFFLRERAPVSLPPSVPVSVEHPAMLTTVSEGLINKILAQALGEAVVPPPSRGPFKIKLNGAQIDLVPERRARIISELVVSTGPLKLALHPVVEILFEPQNGRVRIILVNIQLAGVNIPRVWVDGFIQEIIAASQLKMNSTLQQLQTEIGAALFDLETNDQAMILKFR